MRTFCTYFDRNYIAQGLALYRSLEQTQPAVELWILCLDEETRLIASSLDLSRARIIPLDDLLAFEPRLQLARADRSTIEFYYACTPQLVRYVEEAAPSATGVTYVDADVYFFRSPEAFFAEVPDAEILVVEHRSGDRTAVAERGRFNVCFVYFAKTPNTKRALEWWCEMTLKSTAMSAETWGDQKYLDRFPELFESVGILQNAETTLAPWNVWQHDVTTRQGEASVDGKPLVAFHFARLLVIGPHLFSPIRREWLSRKVMSSIYRPYVREIRKSLEQIQSVAPGYAVGHTRRNRRGLALGVLAGRVFYEGRYGLWRLGIYVPNTRKELWARAQVARRRLSGGVEGR